MDEINIAMIQGERGLQGLKGDQGQKGETGNDGYTPQKGVDYFTQSEINEFINEVESSFPKSLTDLSGTLPINMGGTGATTALDALTALGGKASSDFVMGAIVGNGKETKTTTLSFTPKLFIVYLINYPPIKYDSTNECYLYSFAIGNNLYGSTKGLTISGTNVTLKQSQSTPSDGVFLNLNKNYGQYIYFAIKS